jgi:hypothetical protein
MVPRYNQDRAFQLAAIIKQFSNFENIPAKNLESNSIARPNREPASAKVEVKEDSGEEGLDEGSQFFYIQRLTVANAGD